MTYDKKLRCAVFIDGSNLFWGSLKMPIEERWFVDYTKFKELLKDKYRPLLFKFYGAVDETPMDAEHQRKALAQKSLYAKLEGLGYDVITKPLKYIRKDDGTYTTKGDMDIELTMDVIGAAADIDTVVLVAGDSDYLPLVKAMHAQGKYIRIIAFDKLLSWELRTFAFKNTRCSYTLVEDMKDTISFEKDS